MKLPKCIVPGFQFRGLPCHQVVITLLVRTPATDVYYLWWGWSWNPRSSCDSAVFRGSVSSLAATGSFIQCLTLDGLSSFSSWCLCFEMCASLMLPKDSSRQFSSFSLESSSSPKRLRFITSQVFTIHGGLVKAEANLPQHSVFEIMFPKSIW